MSQYPLGFGQWLQALAYTLSKPREIAIVGDPGSADTEALLEIVRSELEPSGNPDDALRRIEIFGDNWVEGDWVWTFTQFDDWTEFKENVRLNVIGGSWNGRAVVGGHFELTHYADWTDSYVPEDPDPDGCGPAHDLLLAAQL